MNIHEGIKKKGKRQAQENAKEQIGQLHCFFVSPAGSIESDDCVTARGAQGRGAP